MSPVAKPGIVKAWMSLRGRPSRSIAFAADDERVGRVEAATDADDDLGLADRGEPLLEAGHLDVVGLVAVEREAGRVVGDEGVAVDLAEQADVAGRAGRG